MHNGHRGNQCTRYLATAMRTETSESLKCRSGRDEERISDGVPGGRGGKRTGMLSDAEGVAAQHDADVMMPAGEAAPLKVIEPQLALEVLIAALNPPPLLGEEK